MILNTSFKKVFTDKISLNADSRKRITKEYENIVKYCRYEGFQLFGFIEDKLYGVLEGIPDTYFENGFFPFVIIFPNNYPFKPPEFYFQTKIFHPNIDEFGYVSINILREDWTSGIFINTIILSIQSLLDDPNPDEFLNENAAKLFKENKSEYEKTVRKYTSEFANFEAIQNELKKLNFKIELGN